MFSLGSGYMMIKARTLAARQKVRAVGDYSVSVDRSGTWSGVAQLRASRETPCFMILLNEVLFVIIVN